MKFMKAYKAGMATLSIKERKAVRRKMFEKAIVTYSKKIVDYNGLLPNNERDKIINKLLKESQYSYDELLAAKRNELAGKLEKAVSPDYIKKLEARRRSTYHPKGSEVSINVEVTDDIESLIKCLHAEMKRKVACEDNIKFIVKRIKSIDANADIDKLLSDYNLSLFGED